MEAIILGLMGFLMYVIAKQDKKQQGWTFENGIWTHSDGDKAYVQAEADGTFTAVHQDALGNYHVIWGFTHVRKEVAERAVLALVRGPDNS